MPSTLKYKSKHSLTLDKLENDSRYFQNKLKELKFESASPLNQLKKLFIYLALLFIQKNPDNKKDIAAENKLIPSFEALDSIEESNSFVQAKLKEIKSFALEYLEQQKTRRDNLHEKLKIGKSNSNETEHTKVSNGAEELLGMLREVTKKNPMEHEAKLQKSYTLLKMQPWVDGESKEDFQSRLTDSTIDTRMNVKTIADADFVKTKDVLADIDDAYKYLRNFASPSSIKPAPNSGADKEETENNTSSVPSLKHR